MKLRLATLVAVVALVIASLAQATTYYVRPQGSDGAAGTSYTAAWSTIAKANATISGGDVVYVYPGYYTDFPNPAAAGASEVSRFTFIGAHLSGDPTADSTMRRLINLPGGTLSKPFVSISGARIGGSLTMGTTARKDSLTYVQVVGVLDVGDADYCIFNRCTFNGPTFYAAAQTGQHAIGDEFWGCNFWRLGLTYTAGPPVVQFGAISASALIASVDSCVFDFNRFEIQLEKNGDPLSHAFVTYGMRDCALRGNHLDVHNLHATGRWGALILSDSTSRNAFDCDTINADGPTQVQWSAANVLTPKTVGRNTIDSSWVKVEDCPAGFPSGLNHDILTRSTFVGGGTGMTVMGALGRSYVDHCTIAGGGAGSGVLRFAVSSPAWVDNTIITNSIIYSFDPPTNDCVQQANYRSGMLVPVSVIDSSYYAGGAHVAHLRTDGNLYSYYGHSSSCLFGADTLGQRSIAFLSPWGDGGNAPRPYALASSVRAPWDSLWCAGCDDSSRYGSPMFRDSTRLNFDPAPALYSRAIGGDLSGGDIGAVASTAQAHIETGPPAYFNDYGPVQTRTLVIQNIGTPVLSITHITPGHSSLAASQDTLSVGGGATAMVTITFTPTGDGSAPPLVNFSIASNDPVRPTTLWPCYIDVTGGGGGEYDRRR